MKAFIIHYTKLKERKDFIDYQLKDVDINFEYITNFDKDLLTNKIIDEYYEKCPKSYHEKTKNLWSRQDSRYKELNLSEISCNLKHIEALKKASLLDESSLIIEDDCCFVDGYSEKIKNIKSELPEDWDVVFLGSGCGDWFQKIKIKSFIDIGNCIYKANHPASNCTECFLIKPESAEKIYNNIKPFNLIIDWELSYIFYKLDMNIYWVYPSIADQGSKNGMYKSELDLGQR